MVLALSQCAEAYPTSYPKQAVSPASLERRPPAIEHLYELPGHAVLLNTRFGLSLRVAPCEVEPLLLDRSEGWQWLLGGLAPSASEPQLLHALEHLTAVPGAGLSLDATQLTERVVDLMTRSGLSIVELRHCTQAAAAIGTLCQSLAEQRCLLILDDLPQGDGKSSRSSTLRCQITWPNICSAKDAGRVSALSGYGAVDLSVGCSSTSAMDSTEAIVEMLAQLRLTGVGVHVTWYGNNPIPGPIVKHMTGTSAIDSLSIPVSQARSLRDAKDSNVRLPSRLALSGSGLSCTQARDLDGMQTCLSLCIDGDDSMTQEDLAVACLPVSVQKRIERLVLNDCPVITPGVLAPLSEVNELRVLSIRNASAVTGAELHGLLKGGRVEWLDLSGTRCTGDWGAFKKAEVGSLRVVRAEHSGLGDGALGALGAASSLRYLDVSDNPDITAHGWDLLAQCKDVRHVAVRNTSIADDGLQRLLALQSVVALDLQGCHGLSDSGIDALTRRSTICWIDVSRCKGLTATAGMSMMRCASLRDLILDDTNTVDDDVLAGFVEGQRVRSLSIARNARITLKGLHSLKGCGSLRCLNVVGCRQFEQKDIQELRSALPLCIVKWE